MVTQKQEIGFETENKVNMKGACSGEEGGDKVQGT